MYDEDFYLFFTAIFGVMFIIFALVYVLVPDASDTDTFKQDCRSQHGIVKTVGDQNYCVLDGVALKE